MADYQRLHLYALQADGAYVAVGRALNRIDALAKLSYLADPPMHDGPLAADVGGSEFL